MQLKHLSPIIITGLISASIFTPCAAQTVENANVLYTMSDDSKYLIVSGFSDGIITADIPSELYGRIYLALILRTITSDIQTHSNTS